MNLLIPPLARSCPGLLPCPLKAMNRLWRPVALPFHLLLAFLLSIPALRATAVDFNAVEYAGKRYTVCRVDIRKERLQLFLRDGRGEAFQEFNRLAPWLESRGQKLVFAMNAGMFHSDFSPVGLFVAEGNQAFPLNAAEGKGNFFLKPNGVFAVTPAGAMVVEPSLWPTVQGPVQLATQSGPLLVAQGKIHPAFNAGSQSRLFRNGVGVPSPGTAIFVISASTVNFHEFATFFRDFLHCPDALYLDGTISSLYAPVLKRNDFRAGLGPIIGVTE